jgi:hypothetical protein
MGEDPIVAEIRRVRRAHSEQFNNDIHAICEDYRRMQRESGANYITLPSARRKSGAQTPSSLDQSNTKEPAN